MKRFTKNEKGITGIDITVAIFIITIFVGLLATLFYNINSNSASIERKTEATQYAITEIENIKNMDFQDIEKQDNTDEYPNGETIEDTPYAKRITVIDYTEIEGNESKTKDVVKKVTVEILYKDDGITKTVTLSTIVTTNKIGN